MSQSQHSDFASSLYDGDIDNIAYLTPSNQPATPSGSQHTFDTFEPDFLRPTIPPLIPEIFSRVGPDRRKAFVLYDKMAHNN
jgi:hypothetical protein